MGRRSVGYLLARATQGARWSEDFPSLSKEHAPGHLHGFA